MNTDPGHESNTFSASSGPSKIMAKKFFLKKIIDKISARSRFKKDTCSIKQILFLSHHIKLSLQSLFSLLNPRNAVNFLILLSFFMGDSFRLGRPMLTYRRRMIRFLATRMRLI